MGKKYNDSTIFALHNGDATCANTMLSYCPAGCACWSMRLYEAICKRSIPIILARGVVQPFERFLNWSTFVETFL